MALPCLADKDDLGQNETGASAAMAATRSRGGSPSASPTVAGEPELSVVWLSALCTNLWNLQASAPHVLSDLH